MNNNQRREILTVNFLNCLFDLMEKQKINRVQFIEIYNQVANQISDIDFPDQIQEKINSVLHQNKLYSEVDYQSIKDFS